MTLTDEQIIKCLYVEREARKAAGDRHQSVSAQGLVQAGYAAGLSAQPESKPATLTEDRELAQRFMQEADEGEDSIEELLKQCVSFCRAHFQQQVEPPTQPGMVMVPVEPTVEMKCAGMDEAFKQSGNPEWVSEVWKRMIAAAPREGR